MLLFKGGVLIYAEHCKYICVCVCVCIYIYICMYMCVCVCVYVCVCVCLQGLKLTPTNQKSAVVSNFVKSLLANLAGYFL